MNIIKKSARPKFTDSAALRKRFQQFASKKREETAIIDKLDRMAEGFLSLDGTEHDQDDKPGSVAITDDKGMIAYAQASPLGGVLTFDYLDENGAEAKEYSIAPDYLGVHYEMSIGGATHEIYQKGNGLLAIMEQIQSIMPEEGEDDSEKVDEPKETDKPKETDQPKDSEKPDESEKPKEGDEPKSDKPKSEK